MTIARLNLDRKKPTANGLVALWGAEPTGSSARLIDHSGHRFDAAAFGGGAKWAQDFDRHHNVMTLDGTADDYWEVPNPGTILNGKSLSFAAWIYPEAAGALTPRFIDRDWNDQFSFYWNETTVTFGADLTTTGGAFSLANLTVAITVGAWQHVAYTWDKDDLRLYVDGILRLTSAAYFDGGMANSVNEIVVGNRQEIAKDRFYQGRMTGVRLYDRCLSGGEVSHIYNKTRTDPFGDLRHAPTRRYVHRHRAEVH